MMIMISLYERYYIVSIIILERGTYMANQKLRDYAKNKNVYLWEIANKMNVSEPTITRKLRVDLPKEESQKIISIIDDIANSK